MREKRPFFSLLSRFAPLQCGWVPLLSLDGRMGGGAKKGAIEKCSRNHSRFFESFFCRYACVWEKGGWASSSRIRKGFATKKMRFFFILSTGNFPPRRRGRAVEREIQPLGVVVAAGAL